MLKSALVKLNRLVFSDPTCGRLAANERERRREAIFSTVPGLTGRGGRGSLAAAGAPGYGSGRAIAAE